MYRYVKSLREVKLEKEELDPIEFEDILVEIVSDFADAHDVALREFKDHYAFLTLEAKNGVTFKIDFNQMLVLAYKAWDERGYWGDVAQAIQRKLEESVAPRLR